MVVQGMYQTIDPVKQLNYTELNNYIRNNKIETAYLIGEQDIEGTLKDGTKFKSTVPAGKMAELSDLLIANNVDVVAQAPGHLMVGCFVTKCDHLNCFCCNLVVYSQSDAGW